MLAKPEGRYKPAAAPMMIKITLKKIKEGVKIATTSANPQVQQEITIVLWWFSLEER